MLVRGKISSLVRLDFEVAGEDCEFSFKSMKLSVFVDVSCYRRTRSNEERLFLRKYMYVYAEVGCSWSQGVRC